MQKYKLDIVTGLVLTGFALVLYLYVIPNFVAESEMGAMSPRFFPKLGVLLIGIGGLLLMLIGYRQQSAENKTTGESQGHWLNVILVIIAIAMFILLFQTIGYYFAAPTALVLLGIVYGGRRPLALFLLAAIITTAVGGVFRYGLNLPLN